MVLHQRNPGPHVAYTFISLDDVVMKVPHYPRRLYSRRHGGI